MKLNLPERIETERLVLVRLSYEDAEELFYSYASKPEATQYLSWPTHQSLKDTRSFLDYATQGWRDGTDYTFTIRLKDNHRLVGSFGMRHEEGKIQFGYVLSPTQWGRGYATEACRKMMSIIKTQHGVYRIFTFVDIDNKASIRVLLKSGLQEEARLEKWFRFVNQSNEPKDCLLFRLSL
jgi:[ribosomal protein S5]-alanine N-acetyltransferase